MLLSVLKVSEYVHVCGEMSEQCKSLDLPASVRYLQLLGLQEAGDHLVSQNNRKYSKDNKSVPTG